MLQMHGDLFLGISVLLFVSQANLDASSPLLLYLSSNTRAKYFPAKLDNFAPKRKVLIEWKQNILTSKKVVFHQVLAPKVS